LNQGFHPLKILIICSFFADPNYPSPQPVQNGAENIADSESRDCLCRRGGGGASLQLPHDLRRCYPCYGRGATTSNTWVCVTSRHILNFKFVIFSFRSKAEIFLLHRFASSLYHMVLFTWPFSKPFSNIIGERFYPSNRTIKEAADCLSWPENFPTFSSLCHCLKAPQAAL
jgi:hypothetical protein